MHYFRIRNSGYYHRHHCHGLILLLLFALPAAARTLYWNTASGFGPFGTGLLDASAGECSVILPLDSACRSTLIVAAANLHGDPWGYYSAGKGKKRVQAPGWGIRIFAGADSLSLAVRPVAADNGIDQSAATCLLISGFEDRSIALPDFAPRSEANVLRLDLEGRNWSLSGGKSVPLPVAEGVLPGEADSIALFAAPGARLALRHASLKMEPEPQYPSVALPDPVTQQYILSRPDPREGFWAPAARDFDEDLIRLGGDYRLFLLSDGPDGFSLLYVSGARAGADSWKRGMVKARLRAGDFDGLYTVEWHDAAHRVMYKDINARFDAQGRLVIAFPYQQSSLTLQRIPLKE